MDNAEAGSGGMIEVEVAVAWPDRQVSIPVEVAAGSTIDDAISASGLKEQHPELDIDPNRIGIFATLRRPDHVVQAGDRIEIYRPLKADPKQVRRDMARRNSVSQS